MVALAGVVVWQGAIRADLTGDLLHAVARANVLVPVPAWLAVLRGDVAWLQKTLTTIFIEGSPCRTVDLVQVALALACFWVPTAIRVACYAHAAVKVEFSVSGRAGWVGWRVSRGVNRADALASVEVPNHQAWADSGLIARGAVAHFGVPLVACWAHGLIVSAHTLAEIRIEDLVRGAFVGLDALAAAAVFIPPLVPSAGNNLFADAHTFVFVPVLVGQWAILLLADALAPVWVPIPMGWALLRLALARARVIVPVVAWCALLHPFALA